jgi:hypothetical protein
MPLRLQLHLRLAKVLSFLEYTAKSPFHLKNKKRTASTNRPIAFTQYTSTAVQPFTATQTIFGRDPERIRPGR